MKCKTCNGLGRTKATEFVGVDEGLREVVILCPTCGGTGKVDTPTNEECDAYSPRTNEQWFCGLSTETKARIMHLVYIAGYTDGFHGAETIPLRDVMEWLKQPHREE